MTDEALKKKREFWINPRAEQIVYSSSGAADKLFIAREKRYQHKEIHVIEYSAYAETKQLLEDAQQVNEMITKEVESCRNFVDAKCQRCDENEARTIEALAEKERLRLDNDHLQLLKQEYLAFNEGMKKQIAILHVEHIDPLTATLKLAEEALEFYSNESNFKKTVWKDDDRAGECWIEDFELYELVEMADIQSDFGMKASETLATIKERMKF